MKSTENNKTQRKSSSFPVFRSMVFRQKSASVTVLPINVSLHYLGKINTTVTYYQRKNIVKKNF